MGIIYCPDCNKKQRRKELLKLGYCKKCGRKHKVSDFLSKDYIKEIKDGYESIIVNYPIPVVLQRGTTITHTYGELE